MILSEKCARCYSIIFKPIASVSTHSDQSTARCMIYYTYATLGCDRWVATCGASWCVWNCFKHTRNHTYVVCNVFNLASPFFVFLMLTSHSRLAIQLKLFMKRALAPPITIIFIGSRWIESTQNTYAYLIVCVCRMSIPRSFSFHSFFFFFSILFLLLCSVGVSMKLFSRYQYTVYS